MQLYARFSHLRQERCEVLKAAPADRHFALGNGTGDRVCPDLQAVGYDAVPGASQLANAVYDYRMCAGAGDASTHGVKHAGQALHLGFAAALPTGVVPSAVTPASIM